MAPKFLYPVTDTCQKTRAYTNRQTSLICRPQLVYCLVNYENSRHILKTRLLRQHYSSRITPRPTFQLYLKLPSFFFPFRKGKHRALLFLYSNSPPKPQATRVQALVSSCTSVLYFLTLLLPSRNLNSSVNRAQLLLEFWLKINNFVQSKSTKILPIWWMIHAKIPSGWIRVRSTRKITTSENTSYEVGKTCETDFASLLDVSIVSLSSKDRFQGKRTGKLLNDEKQWSIYRKFAVTGRIILENSTKTKNEPTKTS